MDHGEDYSFVTTLAESCIHIALSPRETEEASHDDEELMRVKHFKRLEGWDQSTHFPVCMGERQIMGLW